MAFQSTESIELGEIKVSKNLTTVFTVSHIGASIVVVMYDRLNKVGGLAHVILPDSSLSDKNDESATGKYADLAVPELVRLFMEEGGEVNSTEVRMIGGAQLFNFGGGSANILNIGSRNATAIRTAMSRHGLAIEKADIGGNKAKSLRFVVATGQVVIRIIGGPETQL